MSPITFGTDGVRGRAFDELTLHDAFLIGRAAADVFGGTNAVIGRDTRESGPALTSAVAAGLAAGGVVALDLGVAPTPAVAHVAGARGAVGVMVSASHNPWFDNGIKLFSSRGSKLSDQEQHAVERRLAELASQVGGAAADSDEPASVPAHAAVESIGAQVGEWVRAVKASVTAALDGLRIVLDCANGAASHVVAPAFADLGAQVTAMCNEPDGRNINDGCGSTHPQALARAVVDLGADLGLALDGDADRLLAVDHTGAVVDGDQIMALLATDLHERGRLGADTLVVTVMSNLGLLRAMEAAGITVEVTPVGDRNVLIAMERLGAGLGGEQSGHLIFADHGGTGDGFLSGLQLASLVVRQATPLHDLADGVMERFPQVLQNVSVSRTMPDVAEQIRAEIDAVEAELGDQGRVLVRASGTEPVVRVMVEASTPEIATDACTILCEAVRSLA